MGKITLQSGGQRKKPSKKSTQNNEIISSYADIFTTMNSKLIMVRGINKKNMWSAFEGVEMFLSPSGFHGWASYAPSQNLVDAFGTADVKEIPNPNSGYNPQHPYINRDPSFMLISFTMAGPMGGLNFARTDMPPDILMWLNSMKVAATRHKVGKHEIIV